jgi:hypothetical protein
LAFLEIDGILNGRRLRRCSPTGHWRYGYYLLLANGYGRIEMDFESISYRLVSFRGTAPTPQDIEVEFKEYEANHLIFVYEHNGRKWAQFDTPNSGSKEWKTYVDLKSPMPPEEAYSEWLKEQHGDQWKKFHWYNPAHKAKGIKQCPAWASPTLAKDLTKSTPSSDQGSALGLGLVSETVNSKKPKTKSSPQKPAEVLPQDSWHTRIKAMIRNAWSEQNQGAECPWGPEDGKQLKLMRSKSPEWVDGQYAQCLANMYASSGFPRSKLPFQFLPRLCSYLSGPRNEFDREKSGVTGNHKNDQRSFDIRSTAAKVRERTLGAIGDTPGGLQEQVVGSGTPALDRHLEPRGGKVLNAGDSGGGDGNDKKSAFVRGSGA